MLSKSNELALPMRNKVFCTLSVVEQVKYLQNVTKLGYTVVFAANLHSSSVSARVILPSAPSLQSIGVKDSASIGCVISHSGSEMQAELKLSNVPVYILSM